MRELLDYVRAGNGPAAVEFDTERFFVVDCRIGAEQAGNKPALGRAAGNPDDLCPAGLGKLHHAGADRAGCTRNQHHIARLNLADRDQSDPGGKAGGNAEQADKIGGRHALLWHDLGQRCRVHQRHGLGRKQAIGPVTHRKGGVTAFHHLADPEGADG